MFFSHRHSSLRICLCGVGGVRDSACRVREGVYGVMESSKPYLSRGVCDLNFSLYCCAGVSALCFSKVVGLGSCEVLTALESGMIASGVCWISSPVNFCCDCEVCMDERGRESVRLSLKATRDCGRDLDAAVPWRDCACLEAPRMVVVVGFWFV